MNNLNKRLKTYVQKWTTGLKKKKKSSQQRNIGQKRNWNAN